MMAQTTGDKSNDRYRALASLSVLAMIAAMLTVVISRLADHLRPRVGDIIAFDSRKVISPDIVILPDASDSPGTESAIEVTPAGIPSTGTCLLNPRTMRRSGGSLIIEVATTGSKFPYRVHWAGGPTSDARTSCGISADLLLSPSEIGALKMAASQ